MLVAGQCRGVEEAREAAQAAPDLTTAALAEIAERHPWFGELDAEHRSWVTLVARAGIDGFVRWFAEDGRDVNPAEVFDAAPRALMRRITSAEGTTSSIRQPFELPTSMNSMKRRM